MLPGFVAGHYTFDEIHLDLEKLCQFSNIRLFHTSAIEVSPHQNNGNGGRIKCCDGRPPVRYDALSIDIGSSPAGTPPQYVTPVKPIAHFCNKYQALHEFLRTNIQEYTPAKPFILLVVGGGAGGIELALSVQYNLQTICRLQGVLPEIVRVIVATRGDVLLEQHNVRVQRKFQRILSERNVQVRYQAQAVNVKLTTGGETMHEWIMIA